MELEVLNKYDWGLFDQDIYPAGYIDDDEIEGKVSVFRSGKLISSGGKSIDNSIRNLVHAQELLTQARLVQRVTLRPQVRNIVAAVDIGHRLDLLSLAKLVPNMLYEPEQFPGGIIRSKGESTSFLIFASGKAVIVGTKTIPELKQALRKLEEIDTRNSASIRS